MLQTGLPKRGSQHSDELIELAIAVRDQGFQRPAARARLAGCSNVTISCAWLDNQPIPKFPRQRLKNCCPSRAEPKVRIHLPPAESRAAKQRPHGDGCHVAAPKTPDIAAHADPAISIPGTSAVRAWRIV